VDEIEAKDAEPSNADLARLIEQAMIRFQNWRVEVELNPNPRMVHSLRNLMSIVDAITAMSEKRMQYSYKSLLTSMAELVNEMAALNNAVVTSLEDDKVSEEELRQLTDRLVALVNSAVGLIRLVQESFAVGGARNGGLLEAAPLRKAEVEEGPGQGAAQEAGQAAAQEAGQGAAQGPGQAAAPGSAPRSAPRSAH